MLDALRFAIMMVCVFLSSRFMCFNRNGLCAAMTKLCVLLQWSTVCCYNDDVCMLQASVLHMSSLFHAFILCQVSPLSLSPQFSILFKCLCKY